MILRERRERSVCHSVVFYVESCEEDIAPGQLIARGGRYGRETLCMECLIRNRYRVYHKNKRWAKLYLKETERIMSLPRPSDPV